MSPVGCIGGRASPRIYICIGWAATLSAGLRFEVATPSRTPRQLSVMDLRRPPARDDSASQSPRPAKSRKVEPVNPPQLSGLDCLLQSAKPEEANYIRVDLDDTEIHCGEICIEQADVSAELQTFVVFSPTVVLQEEITDADGFGLKTDEPGYIAIDFLDNLLGTNGAKQDSSTLVVDIGIGATRSRSRCYTKLRALRRQEGETLAFNFTHGHLPQVCVEMHGKMEPILFTPKENPRKWSVVVFCTGFSQDVLMDATSSPLGSLRVQARMQPRRNLLTETLAWRLSLDDAFMDAAFVIEDENRVRTHFPMHAAVAAAHSDVLKRAFDARGFQNSREWLLEKTSPATAKTAHVVSFVPLCLFPCPGDRPRELRKTDGNNNARRCCLNPVV